VRYDTSKAVKLQIFRFFYKIFLGCQITKKFLTKSCTRCQNIEFKLWAVFSLNRRFKFSLVDFRYYRASGENPKIGLWVFSWQPKKNYLTKVLIQIYSHICFQSFSAIKGSAQDASTQTNNSLPPDFNLFEFLEKHGAPLQVYILVVRIIYFLYLCTSILSDDFECEIHKVS
jgi:hypothetical protein